MEVFFFFLKQHILNKRLAQEVLKATVTRRITGAANHKPKGEQQKILGKTKNSQLTVAKTRPNWPLSADKHGRGQQENNSHTAPLTNPPQTFSRIPCSFIKELNKLITS